MSSSRRQISRWDKVEELGTDRAAVQTLPLGSFLSWNRPSRARLDGRVL